MEYFTYVCGMKIKPQQRIFLGKTENFDNKEERRFYQKMLKAYLKGAEFFQYGWKTVGRIREPNMVKVEQQYL